MRFVGRVALACCAFLVSVTGVGIADDTAGTDRGYLGFRMVAAGDRAKVTEVAPGGPGHRAGLRVGDQVVAFNGVGFKFERDLDLIRGLAWVVSGVPVDLTVERESKRLNLLVLPERFPESDLRKLNEWLERAEKADAAKLAECALQAFRDLAAPPGIEVTIKKVKAGDGYELSAGRHRLPAHLDLEDPFFNRLLAALKVGDAFVVHYEWKRGALHSKLVRAPEYVDVDAVDREARKSIPPGRVATEQNQP